jgi:hypothetical protein
VKKISCLLIALLMLAQGSLAQTARTGWKRSAPAKLDLQLFHSQHALNLPTAETLQKGDMEFEISHRFVPAISAGSESAFGVDGPVNMRFSLGYAVTNRWMVTLGRTNVADQIDLLIKNKTWELKSALLPLLVGVQGGFTWNSEPLNRKKLDLKNCQIFGQLILNTMYKNSVGFGFVPTYLYNSYIYCPREQHSLTLGSYLQYWFTSSFSLCTEWIPTWNGWRRYHNSAAVGLEIETGGHFFKILVTNNTLVNGAQVHAGAENPFKTDEWRIGFMITRLIKL